jgi:hypothetical protein
MCAKYERGLRELRELKAVLAYGLNNKQAKAQSSRPQHTLPGTDLTESAERCSLTITAL